MVLWIARALRVSADVLEATRARHYIHKAPDDLSGSVEFIMNFRYGHIHPIPYQIPSEVLALLERVADLKPRTVVELGTAGGGTLFLFTRAAADNATLISVDLEGGPFGGGYPAATRPFIKSFARQSQTIHLVRGDSRAPTTLAAVKRALGGRAIDFLFIDGGHDLDVVQSDFETYFPLVAAGGLIALHDIVPGDRAAVGDVPQYWARLRDSADHEEIVDSWQQGGYGIGLIRKAG